MSFPETEFEFLHVQQPFHQLNQFYPLTAFYEYCPTTSSHAPQQMVINLNARNYFCREVNTKDSGCLILIRR